MRGSHVVVAAVTSGLLAAGVLAAAAPSLADEPFAFVAPQELSSSDWWFTELPTLVPEQFAQNNAVDCLGDTCWIVGWTEERVDEQARIVRVPMLTVVAGREVTQSRIPRGDESVDPVDISCPQAGWCMAVGTSTDIGESTQPIRTWAARYAGGRWTTVPTPSPTQADLPQAYLHGVSCTATDSCIAVGFYFDGVGDDARGLMLRWNGSRWQRIESQATGSQAIDAFRLTAVDCPAADRCVIVGVTSSLIDRRVVMRQWTPKGWRAITRPQGLFGANVEVHDVSCVGIGSCLVVGTGMRIPVGEADARAMIRTTGRTSQALTFPRELADSPYLSLEGVAHLGGGAFMAVGATELTEIGVDRVVVRVAADNVVTAEVPFPNVVLDDGGPLMDVACDLTCSAVGHYVDQNLAYSVPYVLIQR